MSSGMETSCTETSSTEQGSSVLRDLRTENARLGHMLEAAEDVALRYTTLLREGNHRIKNSLQIVASLMSVQERREGSASARQALRTAAGRIQSVARMHDALQASEGEDSVELGVILKTMCASLQGMGGEALGVKVRVEAEPVLAPVAYAQPIVLAVNELVVNALRHAFPNGRAGSISVRLEAVIGGNLLLTVSDDGIGLAAGHGHGHGNGYGMKLVRMMAEQLGGTVSINGAAGTRVAILLPEPKPTPPYTPPPRLRHVRDMLTLLPRKPWNAGGRG